jgi:hypothetical protein
MVVNGRDVDHPVPITDLERRRVQMTGFAYDSEGAAARRFVDNDDGGRTPLTDRRVPNLPPENSAFPTFSGGCR